MPGVRCPQVSDRRRAVRELLVGGACLAALAIWCGTAAGREWRSRTGEHGVEAELIDAGSDYAILQRTADGKLIRVPFAQLSLGDIQYVHEALKAAGKLPEVTPAATPAETPAERVAQPAPAEKPKPDAAPSGPPLAEEGRADWQVVPDPPQEPAVIPATANIRISVPGGIGHENVVFAGPGSPFVALRNGDSGGGWEMWDLRTGQRVGAIREALTGVTKLAISPDGRHLAAVSFQFQGKIRIWSFETGKAVADVELGGPFGGVYGLDFAGPDRLVAALPTEKGLLVWDWAAATRVAKVDLYPTPMQDAYAISPGGSYAAIVKDQRIELVDLRNGVHAGDLALPAGATSGFAPIRAADFSADGREFAVLVEQSQQKRLCCWSLADGQLVAQHALSDRVPRHMSAGSNARSVAIDWIPGDKGWLVYGAALVDRQQGGPVWVAEGRGLALLGRNFRRVVDGQRMLVMSGELRSCTLALESIPWDTIAASQRIVAEGGTVADLGLPPLTQPDWTAVKQRSLADEPADFAPHQPAAAAAVASFRGLRLDARLGVVQKVCFSAPDAGRVLVNADPRDPTSRKFDMIGAQAGPLSDLYDLGTGQRVAQFDIPFAAELLDFSPSGTWGLFRHMPDKDRLDIFDLTTGKHVRGFRPVRESGASPAETVKWAGLLDEERLLTLSSTGRLVLWSLKDCRAEYELPSSASAHAFVDASRTYVALGGDGEVQLIEGRTGRPCGRLPLPASPPAALVMSYAAFRQDGQRLAASFYLDQRRRRLIVWETVPAKILCDLTLRAESFGLTWTGPDHVALYEAMTRDQLPSVRRQVTLVDVAARRVVWKYLLDIGADKIVGPDDRLWCCAMEGTQARRLIAVALPDPKASEVIAAVPPPKPLFGRDTKVALQIRIGGMPDELEDRRKREDQIDRELRRHFTDALQERGVTVASSAPATLTVAIKTLTSDELIVIRTRLGLRGSHTIVLAKSAVHARLAIEMQADKQSSSTVLWEEETLVESAEVHRDECPKDLPLSAFIQLRQWESARDWCQRTPLPTELYHPDAYRGLGESSLTATGVQFIRRY